MQLKNDIHYFQISDAEEYGVEEAIMLSNIRYWVDKNTAEDSERHFHEGVYWTYNSKKAFAKLFPYWTEKQIRRILNNLIIVDAIFVGNFNKKGYDRTSWYTTEQPQTTTDNLKQPQQTPTNTICPNGQNHLPKQSNAFAHMGQPIPDNKPDNKPNDKQETVNTSSPKKSVVKKTTKHLPENKGKEVKEKVGNSNSVKNILDKQKNKLDEKLEEIEYLHKLTPYQLMNPKEFKGSTSGGKKLTRIATDTYILFTHTCKKNNPDMGIIVEPRIKDIAMMGSLIKKLGGDLDLLVLIVENWQTFKKAVEAQHATKVKKTYPNLPVMIMYAEVASSEGFLGKITEQLPEEDDGGKEWDL